MAWNEICKMKEMVRDMKGDLTRLKGLEPSEETAEMIVELEKRIAMLRNSIRTYANSYGIIVSIP